MTAPDILTLIADKSGWALALTFIIMFIRGDIVPKVIYDRAVKERDEYKAMVQGYTERFTELITLVRNLGRGE